MHSLGRQHGGARVPAVAQTAVFDANLRPQPSDHRDTVLSVSGPPVGIVKTNPLSCQSSPARARSSCCRCWCCRRMAVHCSGRDAVRRDRAFGSANPWPPWKRWNLARTPDVRVGPSRSSAPKGSIASIDSKVRRPCPYVRSGLSRGNIIRPADRPVAAINGRLARASAPATEQVSSTHSGGIVCGISSQRSRQVESIPSALSRRGIPVRPACVHVRPVPSRASSRREARSESGRRTRGG